MGTGKAVVTAYVYLDVSVMCESCSEQFTYQHKVQVSSSSHFVEVAGERADAMLGPAVRNAVGRSRLGWHRCPSCRYIQSWMEKAYTQDKGWEGAGIGFALWMLLALLMYVNKVGDRPTVVFFVRSFGAHVEAVRRYNPPLCYSTGGCCGLFSLEGMGILMGAKGWTKPFRRCA